MSFVAAKCPQCGGDLQLDNEKEAGFCMHCGSKLIVKDAIKGVRIDNSHMIDRWMQLGESAGKAGNYQESYEYFTKVVEIDPENWQAIFSKAKSACFQSTYGHPRFNELFQGIGEAQKIILRNNFSDEERDEAWRSFAMVVYNLTLSYFEIVSDIRRKKLGGYSWDLPIVKEAYDATGNCIDYLHAGLGIIDAMEDEKSKSLRLRYLHDIYYLCQLVCSNWRYKIDTGYNSLAVYWGYQLSEKKRFIETFDEVCFEIRKVEPEFEKGGFIDRLEPPFQDSDLVDEARDRANKQLQGKIDRDMKIKIDEDRQKKYWEDHPNEYEEHLAIEQRRKVELLERRTSLQLEVNNLSSALDHLNSNNDLEIQRLISEREKLGIFAGKQKKEIDDRIVGLKAEIESSRNRFEYLTRELETINNRL